MKSELSICSAVAQADKQRSALASDPSRAHRALGSVPVMRNTAQESPIVHLSGSASLWPTISLELKWKTEEKGRAKCKVLEEKGNGIHISAYGSCLQYQLITHKAGPGWLKMQRRRGKKNTMT